MGQRTQIARVCLRRKDFMTDVGQRIEQAAVGIVNENQGWFHLELTGRLHARTSSVAEILRHHQAAHPAVHNADADAAELRMQDVRTMSQRVH